MVALCRCVAGLCVAVRDDVLAGAAEGQNKTHSPHLLFLWTREPLRVQHMKQWR